MTMFERLSTPLDVRDQFPAIPAGWHYLDTAATAQKPQAVIDAITNGYARDYATVHRGPPSWLPTASTTATAVVDCIAGVDVWRERVQVRASNTFPRVLPVQPVPNPPVRLQSNQCDKRHL